MTDLLRDALRKGDYLSVFLDGRNEHGTHVLTIPGNAVGDGLLEIETILADQGGGIAEQIFKEAEALGHVAGEFAVTVWHWNGPQIERDFPCGEGFDESTGITYGARTYESAPGYWEYDRVCPILTEAMFGTAAEQGAERLVHGG